tara:strand:- start:179 stop:574 length:396 start_codon:yes stop_codon:yes gene_type:complete
MKNNLLIILKYLYYFSLCGLLVLYLFPGSLVGFFLYGDIGKQPDLILNPIGTSINHLIYFFWITILAKNIKIKKYYLLNNINFILFLSIFLEISHFVIPNRSYETYDLIANISGIFFALSIYKIYIWLKKS